MTGRIKKQYLVYTCAEKLLTMKGTQMINSNLF